MVRVARIYFVCLAIVMPLSIAHASQSVVSPYGQDAVYFERAALESVGVPRLQLQHVYGGVVTHHIPNAASLITDFYARLAATQRVETFIIVGPDHFERGSAPITVSRQSFSTPFGTVKPNLQLIDRLIETGAVVHDEVAFNDHAIHSQVLAITRLFPRATIVPLLFRSKGSNQSAAELGRTIAAYAGPNSVIVASVDFSHYLTTQQAMPLDQHAARTLAMLRPDLAGIAEADSPQALTAMLTAVEAMGAETTQTLGVHNSDEFSSRRNDVTTGYVVQFFGSRMAYEPFIGALARMRV